MNEHKDNAIESLEIDTPGFIQEMGRTLEDFFHCEICGEWDGIGFMLNDDGSCPVCLKIIGIKPGLYGESSLQK